MKFGKRTRISEGQARQGGNGLERVWRTAKDRRRIRLGVSAKMSSISKFREGRQRRLGDPAHTAHIFYSIM